MRRGNYIGAAGVASGGSTTVPLQAEAAAYFARMSTPPSSAFQEALNRAIFRWKAVGAWSQIKGLWFLAAETTQAAKLSVIGDTPRDAVVVGTTPTFTASKGYSGFDSGKQLKFPITSTILADNNAFAFLAAICSLKIDDVTDPENPVTIDGCIIRSDAGIGHDVVGNFAYESGSGATSPGFHGAGPQKAFHLVASSGAASIVGGTKGAYSLTAGGIGQPEGGLASVTRSSNYITTPIAFHPMDRLSAYGFLSSAASNAVCKKFLTILAAALDEVGAFD